MAFVNQYGGPPAVDLKSCSSMIREERHGKILKTDDTGIFRLFTEGQRDRRYIRPPVGWKTLVPPRGLLGVVRPFELNLMGHRLYSMAAAFSDYENVRVYSLWIQLDTEHVVCVLLAWMRHLYGDFTMWRLPASLFNCIGRLDKGAVGRMFGLASDWGLESSDPRMATLAEKPGFPHCSSVALRPTRRAKESKQ